MQSQFIFPIYFYGHAILHIYNIFLINRFNPKLILDKLKDMGEGLNFASEYFEKWEQRNHNYINVVKGRVDNVY